MEPEQYPRLGTTDHTRAGDSFATVPKSAYRVVMIEHRPSLKDLRSRLVALLAPGMAEEPIEHATQVAEITAVLYAAFSRDAFEVTLVGGSAIEVHAPGIYRSGDLDVVVEKARGRQKRRNEILEALRQLASSEERVTDQVLRELIDDLNSRA